MEFETDELSNGVNARYYRLKYISKKNVKQIFNPSNELLDNFKHHPLEISNITNIQKYINKYENEHTPFKKYQSEIENALIECAKREEQINDERKKQEQKDIEEGWTVVKKRKTNTDDDLPKKNKKKKKTELKNFYRFQFREEKRNRLAQLREQFEKDKEKIRKMKEQRKFKPF